MLLLLLSLLLEAGLHYHSLHNFKKIRTSHPVQNEAQESDSEAQARAAAAAEQRQQKFDQSAGGRAARKAVLEVLRDTIRPSRHAGRPDDRDEQMAKDWLN